MLCIRFCSAHLLSFFCMQNLFDLSEISFADLIDQEKPWLALEKIENYIQSKRAELIKTGFKEVGEALVHPSVVIDKSAKIIGPALIDAGTKIRDNTLLRDGVIIGKNCEIGHASEIKHSIILNDSNAAHFNYVGDSLVGTNVNLAGGVILANFKNASKNQEIRITFGGEKIDTGFRKLGALIGDGVKLGVNSVTDPGTVVGKNTYAYPLSYLRGEIPSNKLIKNRPNLEIVDLE